MKAYYILALLFMLSCDEPLKNGTDELGGDSKDVLVNNDAAGEEQSGAEQSQNSAGDDEQLFVPSAPMRDELAPSWPPQAELSFDLSDTNDLIVSWPEATDNQAIEAYSLYLNGQLVKRLGAEARSEILQIQPNQESFEVVVIASDTSHNRSNALSGRYLLQDQAPPTWLESAQVIVNDITVNTATLVWTPASDNIAVQSYEIWSNERVLTAVEDQTQYRLLDLIPNTSYIIKIYAVDHAGLKSLTALSVDFETLSDGGPEWSEEAELIAQQSAPTTVILNWTDTGHSEAVRYRIEENRTVVALTHSRTWSRDHLRTPGRYQYAVWAIDERGVSSTLPLESSLDASDLSAPTWPDSALINVSRIENSQIAITWTAALDNDRVDHYLVNWGENSHQVETAALTLDHLQMASEYPVVIRAVDASGNESEHALTTTVITEDNQAPTWPNQAELSLSWTATGALDVEWPAAQDNLGVTGYTISLNTGLAEQIGNSTSYRYENLSAGEDYLVRVLAYDAAGQRSTIALQGTARQTELSAPQWPQNASLLYSNLTENSVRLAWPSAIDHDDRLSYILQWGTQTLHTQEQVIQVDQLEPWTDYTFTLSVIDETGLQSANDLTTQFKTLDLSRPQFLGSEVLSVPEQGADYLVLSWLEAIDNVGVANYELSVNGAAPLVLDSSLTQVQLDHLAPLSTCLLSLHAIDSAGNRSLIPAQLEIALTDTIPPQWPESATLSSSSIGANKVTIQWPPAQDNVAVSEYLVQVDDNVPQRVELGTSLEIHDLMPWQAYRITVKAKDSSGLLSSGLETEVFTSDSQAPTWPNGAALIPNQIEATALTLTWPEANDDVRVESYSIYADGLYQGEVAAELQSFRLEGLQATQLVLAEVLAVDQAGNESIRLRLSVQTIDGGPPTWDDTSLNWQSGLNFIALDWPAAQDDVAVSNYRVIVDGELKLESTETTALLEGLAKGQNYAVHIEACDAANNCSVNGPSESIATLERVYEGFRRLSKLEYTRAVAHLFQGLYGTDDQPRYYCGDPYRVGYCRNAPDGFDGWVKVLTGENGPWSGRGLLGSYPEESKLRGEHELGGGFERLDQRLFDEHIGAWTSVAGNLTQKYFDTNNLRVSGDIPWSKPDGAASAVQWKRCEDELGEAGDYPEGLVSYTRECFARFVDQFGSRAVRRPLSNVELDEFMGYFDAVPTAIPERFEIERQLHCWLEVNQPRWANPKPVPWVWTTEDEDWCAQVSAENLDAMYPTALHLEQAMVDFVPVVMARPEFVYHVEIGDESGALTAHELANRLSFHFWKAPPDRELRELADNGQLFDEEVYTEQVNRLFDDPRAEESVRTFYSGYFWLDSIPNHHTGAKAYLQAHEDWHPSDIRSLGNWYFAISFLGDAAKDELSNLGHYFTREQPGSYQDMFTSNLNFFECQNPSNYQGCSGAGPFGMFVYKTGNCSDYQDCHDRGWLPDTETGYIQGDTPITIPEANRYGLITRIGFLMHETDKERPIRRGLKIRDMLLCDPIPPPENCDVVRVPNLTGLCAQDGVQTSRECSHDSHCEAGQICEDPFRKNNLTVREVVEEMTEQEGTSCATCHARWINGMGHALGNYSSQGLYRPKEPMYQAANIWKSGRHVLSTTLRPQEDWPAYHTQGDFQLEGQEYSINGAEDLANTLSNSGRLESCWAQQYFRYTMGRLETASDQQVIESLADQLRSGASLAQVFKGIAYTNAFKSISKPPSQLSSEDTP